MCDVLRLEILIGCLEGHVAETTIDVVNSVEIQRMQIEELNALFR